MACGELSVELVDTDTDFERLEGVWNKLLWESPRPVPFLTWEWVSTWWKHFYEDSRLFVLVAQNENKNIVGVAPLRIAIRKAFGVVPVRTVEFLGYRGSAVCADHLDFLTSRNNRERIVERLIEAIFAHDGEWDCIVLADLAEDSLLPAILSRQAREQGLSLGEGPQQICPFIRLTPAWELFLRAMKKKRRSFVKCRRERLLQDYKVLFRCDTSVEHVHPHLETLARLHVLSRHRRGQRGNFHLKEYREFHHAVAERMARAGYLYLARLDCDDRPVAAWYGFHLGNVLFFYQTGYDAAFAHLGVGQILNGMIIQDAIDRLHATEFDFLRGAEEYKYFWTSSERRTRTLVHWATGLSSRAARAQFLLRLGLSALRNRPRYVPSSMGRSSTRGGGARG